MRYCVVGLFQTRMIFFFFFNDTATTEIYTLSLHDALPISSWPTCCAPTSSGPPKPPTRWSPPSSRWPPTRGRDRKSTRLNSSHDQISYAVFCLKKKKNQQRTPALKFPH